MKPKGKEYEKYVTIHKVWEEINQQHHLVMEDVSNYIRELESKLLVSVEQIEKLKDELLDARGLKNRDKY